MPRRIDDAEPLESTLESAREPNRSDRLLTPKGGGQLFALEQLLAGKGAHAGRRPALCETRAFNSLSRERSVPMDQISHAPVDQRERVIHVPIASKAFRSLPQSNEFGRANSHQSTYIGIHQEPGLSAEFRKKRASIRKIYTVDTFPKSHPVQHRPSPSMAVL